MNRPAARFATDRFFNFNGTAGIWRRAAIEDAGGWSAATLTEDLDLSYRAQLAGWKFVFRPDVEVPAELPPTIGAFHEQQFRWAKGSMQTARRLLAPIARARVPIEKKIEAFFHLTANSAYAITVLIAILIVPSMSVRRSLHAPWLYLVDALLFAISTLSVMWFYVVGQQRVGHRASWKDLIVLMPVGIGLSARNCAAVVEGLLTNGGEFHRTPKRGAAAALAERAGRLPIGESLLAVYFISAIAFAFVERQFAGMPFLALFLSGYGYTAARSWRERLLLKRSVAATKPRDTAQSRLFTSIIIPALDEEQAIGHVLRDLARECVDEVIVVDNGSRDGTADVAAACGARVIHEPQRGYGAACLAGIAALDRNSKLVVFLDADYSDFPEDLPHLLRPIYNGQADFVLGTRTHDRNARRALTLAQRCGNWLATQLIRTLWRHKYTDMGPFRAIKREALAKLSMVDRGFGWNIEMQMKAVRKSLRIVEVPVRYRLRIGKSKISGTVRGTILAGAKILYTIGKYACSS